MNSFWAFFSLSKFRDSKDTVSTTFGSSNSHLVLTVIILVIELPISALYFQGDLGPLCVCHASNVGRPLVLSDLSVMINPRTESKNIGSSISVTFYNSYFTTVFSIEIKKAVS